MMNPHVDFQRDVIDRLARIETKLETQAPYGDRIAALEKSKERVMGMAVVVGAISGLLTAMGRHLLHLAS